MKKSESPVIVEESFIATPDKVWSAITQLDQMRHWFFENIPSFRPEIGFTTRFNVRSGGRDFIHLWNVTEVVTNKRIAYGWKYESYSGDSRVAFDLLPTDQGTRLRLTATTLEDFPEDIPEFRRESCVAGWEYFIKDRLKKYLDATR